MVRISLEGKRFGRLTVIKDLPSATGSTGHKKTMSLCICSCGREVIRSNVCLRHGRTTSCGCFRSERAKQTPLKHGHTKQRVFSKTYQSWACMISRCTNPNTTAFKHYGGRGIKTCDRWLEFENFLADMGERPEGKTLSRNNNDGNYEPSNCCWDTPANQARNRRSSRIITVFGKTDCVKALCEHFGANYKRTLARLKLGWTVEDAFSISRFGRPSAE